MGSPCELVCYSRTEKEHRTIIDSVTAEIYRLEKKYSRYRDDSLASAINRTANYPAQKQRRITLDQETSNLLDYAAIAYDQSDGLFDITSGIYRKQWDFRSNHLPNQSDIDDLRDLVGWEKLSWENGELAFTIKGMEIDFGGFVKEYTADLVVTILKRLGVRHGYIDLGGDIAIVGPQPDSIPWRIGIRNPRRPEQPIAIIDAIQGGIASSGDYERYMIVDGERYCHIINPKTGWPVNYWSGVSVFSDLCLIAGTSSTIAMLKESSGKSWLEELGVSSILIDREGSQFTQSQINLHQPLFSLPNIDDTDKPVKGQTGTAACYSAKV